MKKLKKINNCYSIIAPAKLNLNLYVRHKTNNGLHLLKSDVCFLELTDKIYFKFSEKDTFLQSNHDKALLIETKNNLILDALNAFRQFTGWDKKFQINLDKKIPIGAGLGGGSADAAATLILLRKLFNKERSSQKVTISNLHKIANELGADIPACLVSKSLRMSGYGNKIRRNKISYNYYYLLINPNIQLSTKKVFAHFNYFKNNKLPKAELFLDNMCVYNSLLSSAIYLAPEIHNILSVLKTITNVVAYGMSGSGSTCFAIFNNIKDIPPIFKYFNDNHFIWYGKKKDYSINRVHYSKMLENKF